MGFLTSFGMTKSIIYVGEENGAGEARAIFFPSVVRSLSFRMQRSGMRNLTNRLMQLRVIAIFITLLASGSFIHAQQLNLFLNQEYAAYYEQAINNPDVQLHTGFKPLLQSQVNQYMSTDSIREYTYNGPKRSWFYRKFYHENLFIIHDTARKFWATIDPLFDFQATYDKGDSSRKFYNNTRGFMIQAGIGNKFSFSTSFYEDQASFPYYVDKFVQTYQVIPGQGRVKLLSSTIGSSFYDNGYDFSVSEAYMTYTANNHVSFQLGEGKNFVGDGYRSLLLSDNSFDYPYFKVTTTFGRFQYTNLYTIFINTNQELLSIATEGLFQRKAANIQYLSWSATNRLEIGLFQALIWQASDSVTNKQCYNLNYFDPIIGISAARYGFENYNHSILLGSTVKYKISSNIMAYGQLAMNDMGPSTSIKDKTAYQLGVKLYNHLGELLFEYNQVRPYTYTGSNFQENYTNYNQALADPLGANFKELNAQVNFHFAKHFTLHAELDYAIMGMDSGTINYGNNVFLSDMAGTQTINNVKMGQGLKADLNYVDCHLSYLMNPRTNMNIVLGLTYRELTVPSINYKDPSTMMVYFGFRTSLNNTYFDF